MTKYRYEDLDTEGKGRIDAYEGAIEDMYQAMDDFDIPLGESVADMIRADILEEAFTYIKEQMHDCKEMLIEEIKEGENGQI